MQINDAEDYAGRPAAQQNNLAETPDNGYGIDPDDYCSCEGPFCLGCGCCAHRACPGGCVWATPTLCSRCL